MPAAPGAHKFQLSALPPEPAAPRANSPRAAGRITLNCAFQHRWRAGRDAKTLVNRRDHSPGNGDIGPCPAIAHPA